MANYDPQVIQKFADKLYSQANTAVFLSTIIGVLIGGAVGYSAGVNSPNGGTFAMVGAVVTGLLGLVVGLQRSFTLRVQAQIALCQMKIEENTRK